MEENIELKLLRLKKMKQMLSSATTQDAKPPKEEVEFDKYLRIFKENLVDRGEEVLEAAMREYPEITKKIVVLIAQKIIEGKLTEKISGADLLRLFENLGLHIHLETRIRFYKHGEYKSLSDLLRE